MTKDEFKDKIGKGLSKLALSSKKAFGKASVAVQDFSDKSVIKIEKKQFENKRNSKYEELGKKVSEILLSSSDAVITAKNEEITAILDEIIKYGDEIQKRDAQLKAESEVTEKKDKDDSQPSE